MKKTILALSLAASLLSAHATQLCRDGTPSRNPALLDGFRSTLAGQSYLTADGKLFMQFTDDANFMFLHDANDGSSKIIPLYKDTKMACLVMQGILNGELVRTDDGGAQ